MSCQWSSQVFHRPAVNLALKRNNLIKGIPIAHPAPVIELRLGVGVHANGVVIRQQSEQKPFLATNPSYLDKVPANLKASFSIESIGVLIIPKYPFLSEYSSIMLAPLDPNAPSAYTLTDLTFNLSVLNGP